MQKFTKRLAVIVMALIATVCLAVCMAACNKDDDEKYATDTFTVTVLDENGNPIDGTTFGQGDWDPDDHQVTIQFCSEDNGCTAFNPKVGKDGKATIKISDVKLVTETGKVELHVLGVEKVGYKKEYSQYSVNKIPLEITVKLEKKA